MESLPRVNRNFLLATAVVVLTLASAGKGTVNDGIEQSKDSLVTGIVTTGGIGRIDELIVLKNYDKELYIMCIGDFEAQSHFLLFFKHQRQKPKLLLILKVDSCAVNNQDKLKQSVVLKSYDSDLTNIEVMVRVKNKGCERYTSVDRRMSPCECGEPRVQHRWTELSHTDSTRILEDIRSDGRSTRHGMGDENVAAFQTSMLTYPTKTGSIARGVQEIADQMAISKLTTTFSGASVRPRRGAGQVILTIIAIPICIVAFIVMAAILIPVGIVVGAAMGFVGGIKMAGEGTEKLYNAMMGY